jgi:hypothetical protein
VCQAVRVVEVVVVSSIHGATGPLVLADRPVLNIVVSAVDAANLVVAAITVESANILSLAARVVGPKVLENLSKVSETAAVVAQRRNLRSSRRAETRCRQQDRNCLGRSRSH